MSARLMVLSTARRNLARSGAAAACQFSSQAPLQAPLPPPPPPPYGGSWRPRHQPSTSSSLMDVDQEDANRSPRNNPKFATGLLQRLYDDPGAPQSPGASGAVLDTKAQLRNKNESESYMKQFPRKWQDGDLYAPRDLGAREARKYRQLTSPKTDVVDALGLKPLDLYRNFAFISEFMTEYGRIRPASQTSLRPVNQRKMAKAIRRAIGLGLHPSVHLHPELLAHKLRNLPARNRAASQSVARAKPLA